MDRIQLLEFPRTPPMLQRVEISHYSSDSTGWCTVFLFYIDELRHILSLLSSDALRHCIPPLFMWIEVTQSLFRRVKALYSSSASMDSSFAYADWSVIFLLNFGVLNHASPPLLIWVEAMHFISAVWDTVVLLCFGWLRHWLFLLC